MSISIYYSAKRSTASTELEKRRVAEIVGGYSVAAPIDEYHRTGSGWTGEDFCLYDPPFDSAETILEGATKLPSNTQDDFLTAVQHWCQALSEIRRVLSDSYWHVHIDDQDIEWDGKSRSFGEW